MPFFPDLWVQPRIDLGNWLWECGRKALARGRPAQAERLFSLALACFRSLGANVADADHVLTSVQLSLARALRDRLALAQARALLDDCLAARRRLMVRSPQSEQAQKDLSDVLEGIGELCFHECGEAEEAATFYEEAARLREQLARSYPTTRHHQMALARAMGKHGVVLSHLKAFREAEQLLQRSLDIITELSASDPSDETSERNLAYALSEMGILRRDSGDLDAARELFENSYYIRRSRAEACPDDKNRLVDMGIGLDLLGGALAMLGNDVGARSRLEEALSIFRKVAKDAPSSALVARHLWMVMYRLAFYYPNGPVRWPDVVNVMEAMQRAGTFLPTDQSFLAEARLYQSGRMAKANNSIRSLVAAPTTNEAKLRVVLRSRSTAISPSDEGQWKE